MLHEAVAPAHHVTLQRRQRRFAVALEQQRPRLVQAVQDRFSETATERPAHEPLQLHSARRSHRQEVLKACVYLIRSNPNPLELRQ